MRKNQATFAIVFGLFIGTAGSPASAEWESDRVFFNLEGAGRPVIVIPGLTSSPDVFKEPLTELNAPDRAFHWATLAGFAGTSAPQDLTAYIQPAANELARYISDQNLHDVALIGHSMGGVISLLVAARETDRIDRILIVDAVPFLPGLLQVNANAEEAATGRAPMLAEFNALSDDQFAMRMRQGLPFQATSREAQAIVWADIERSDRHAIAIAMSEIFSTDYGYALPKITAKTTVLTPHNEYSPGSPESLLARYKTLYKGLADVELRAIENSRHFIMLDQPEVFAQEVERFLQEPEDE